MTRTLRRTIAIGVTRSRRGRQQLRRARPARDKNRKNQRPKLSLKAQPNVGIAPARIVLTAELTGAPTTQDYYRPTVLWDWADGTESESTFDCEPCEAGKSEIKRRYTVQHTFRAGAHKVWVRLKRNDKSSRRQTSRSRFNPAAASKTSAKQSTVAGHQSAVGRRRSAVIKGLALSASSMAPPSPIRKSRVSSAPSSRLTIR